MAISVVQSVQAGSQASGTFTATFGSNVAARNTILLGVATFTAAGALTISSASPTFGGSPVTGAVKLKEAQSPWSGAFTAYAALWMLPNVAGGAASVGITVTNGTLNNSQTGLLAWEVAGLGTAPVPDQSSSSSTVSGGATTGTTGATTQPAEIIVGLLMGLDGLLNTPTVPAGYTNLNIGSVGSASCGGYQIQSSAGGTYVYAATNNGTDPSAGVIVTVSPPLPVLTRQQQQSGRSMMKKWLRYADV